MAATGRPNPAPRPLAGRVALITGASRGIGAAVARRYAQEGAQVILTARNVEGLTATDDAIRACAHPGDPTPVLAPADLTKPEEIAGLAAAIASRFGRLDILLGNAGELGTLTPVPHIDPAEWDKVLAVNLSANWHLIRNFEPLLKASDAGRAIFVTSAAGAAPKAYWSTYAVSKAALDQLVLTWAAECQKTPLRINLIDPGAVRTVMRTTAYPGEDPASLPSPDDITDPFVALAAGSCPHHGTRQVIDAQSLGSA